MPNKIARLSGYQWVSRSVLPVVLACLIAPLVTARSPQENRQLNREQAESNSASERRIALVIGNGTYTNAPPLKNPPNDAHGMAATLKTLGFEVATGVNVNQREMKRLIREFGQSLKAGGSGLFYYAGHGVQSKGHNYLIPIDADIQSEAEVEDSGVDVSLVLNYMDDAQNGLNIVILDACRNNPFARSFRAASNGLAQVDAPTGTLIAYATAPGRVASDGTGQNGLYTAELLKQMRVPGLSATDMFMQVRAEVMKQTSNNQVPWEASSLVGAFYFNGSTKNTSSADPSNAETRLINRIDPAQFELSYWETIKNSTDPEDFKSYLEKYPNGQFSPIAKRRLLPQSQTEQFQISATVFTDGRTNGWTNSGLVVRRGQQLQISATGRILLRNSQYSGPEGVAGLTNVKRLIANEPAGALIAVIGDDNDDFIFIGRSRAFRVERDGVLFLGVNEHDLRKNSGTFDVIIKVEKLSR